MKLPSSSTTTTQQRVQQTSDQPNYHVNQLQHYSTTNHSSLPQQQDENNQNVICISSSTTNKWESMIHYVDASMVAKSSSVTCSTIYDWLQQNMRNLLPQYYSTASPFQHNHVSNGSSSSSSSSNSSSNKEQDQCYYRINYRLVSENKYILALNHKCSTVWDKAKDDPSALKLIFEVFSVESGELLDHVQYSIDYANYYNKKGNEEFRNKKFHEAIEHYNISIKRFPSNLVSLCNRSLCYFRTKDYLKSISDVNQLFIKYRSLELDNVKLDASMIGKSYVRRGRNYYALSEMVRLKMQNQIPENYGSMELLNLITNREQVLKIISSHQIYRGNTSELSLLLLDNATNQSMDTLSAIRLTLLQLCASDFSRGDSEFEGYYKGNKKNEVASIEFDKALWEIMNYIPQRLNICPLTRTPTSVTNLVLSSVIPTSWKANPTNENDSKLYPFISKDTDKFGRISQYEDKFATEVLTSFFYNEHRKSKDDRSDELAIDQSRSSWCSTVLTFIVFKWLFAQPNFISIISHQQNYSFFMRCRIYLMHVLSSTNSSDKLPEKLYPIRFSITPLSGPLLEEPDTSVRISPLFVNGEEDNNESTLQLLVMKFGSHLYVSAGKHDVLTAYKLRGAISHGKEAFLERQSSTSVNFPNILNLIQWN